MMKISGQKRFRLRSAAALLLALSLLLTAACAKTPATNDPTAAATDVTEATDVIASQTDVPEVTAESATDVPATDVPESATPELTPEITAVSTEETPATAELTPEISAGTEEPQTTETEAPATGVSVTPTPAPTAEPTGTATPAPQGPNNIFKEWTSSTMNAFTNLKQTSKALDAEGAKLTYTGTGSGTGDPYAVFDIAKYISLTNRTKLTGEEGSYLVFKVKSTGGDGYMQIFTQTPAAGDCSEGIYVADGQWNYVFVDMTATTLVTKTNLSTMRIDWSSMDTESGATMIISEIGFFKDKAEALSYAGMTEADLNPETVDDLPIPDADFESYVTSTNATLSAVTESGEKAVQITSEKPNPRVFINVQALARAQGGVSRKAHYLAIRFKTSGVADPVVYLSKVMDVSGYSVNVGKTADGDPDKSGWQGVIFDLRKLNFNEDQLRKLVVDFRNLNTSSKVYLSKVLITDDLNAALKACAQEKYMLNYDANLTDNDSLAGSVVKAANEYSGLDLWFDQVTERTAQTVTESTGRTGYTVYMAKNEAENCQFFLAADKNMSVRVEVDPFTSGSTTVPFQLFYEYYHNIQNVLLPDALPPLTGALNLTAGKSQGFMIQLTTAADTPAGTYNSTIHVYDDSTGKEIKRAKVAVKVWNFALSESTELRTSFLMWNNFLEYAYPSDWLTSELYDKYFEFFLQYRINIMDIPHGLTSSYGNRYMSQERVNTARWYNMDMSVTEDCGGVEPTWINKVIYWKVDEPRTNDDFANLIDYANRIRANTPNYRMVCPVDRNLDMAADGTITTFAKSTQDQVQFMSQAVNIWCPKLDAFTTRDLSFISGVSFLQSEEQDAKYGNFVDRMKTEVAGGDELWAYVAINPTEPYVNWQLQSDGTETILTAWQMKQQNVTGMLYWAVNYWKVSYWDASTPWSGTAWGDGMLIYSGYNFGMDTPISSMRLETLRDGIEDYQMLCMLEDALGTDALNSMLNRLTTSVVTYANDDDYVHAVRVLLGETLNKAIG